MSITIKCKSCGYENQIGDVFCRKCGEELELDHIDPEQMKKKRKSKKIGCGVMGFELICLVIILGFLGGIFSLFLTPTGFNFSMVDEEMIGNAKKSAERIQKMIDKRPVNDRDKNPETEVPVEAKIAGQVFKTMAMKGSDYAKAKGLLKVDDGVITFAAKLGSALPITVSVVGRLKEGDENDKTHWRLTNGTTFEITNTKIGMLPTGVQTAPFIKQTFFQFFERDNFAQLRNNLGLITLTEDGNFIVTAYVPED